MSNCQDNLHSDRLYVLKGFCAVFFAMSADVEHKPTSTGQRILDRLRFPLLSLCYRLRPQTLRSRTILPFYLNHHGLIGTGVEIGVQRGFFSQHILRYWRGERLNCVDPWREFPQEEYDEPKDNVPQIQHDAFYRETLTRLKPFGNRARVHRTTSEKAASLIDANSLDFVFIDAQHHYEAVLADMNTWFPKLRPGGLMAGHDWGVDYGPPRFGVKKAVIEFSRHNHLDVHLTADHWTWYIRLPNTD